MRDTFSSHLRPRARVRYVGHHDDLAVHDTMSDLVTMWLFDSTAAVHVPCGDRIPLQGDASLIASAMRLHKETCTP